jgi:inhibitor of Bruton tyrosine kinase
MMDIFEAVERNDVAAVFSLLKNDLNDPNERNDKGLTGLHICATLDLVEMSSLLLDFGADISLKDYESGYSPLHRALYNRNYRVAWFLIRSGAMLDTGIDEFCNGLSLKTRSLSENSRLHVDCRDKEGLTPLALLSAILREAPREQKKNIAGYQTDIFAFGKADFQLGVSLPNSSADVSRPKRIHSLARELVVDIAANKYHSLALTSTGNVYSWGHGRNGRLGHGDDVVQLEPKLIVGIKEKIVFVAAGLNHTLALTATGSVYSWGSDKCGQLGLGTHNTESGIVATPKLIDVLRKEFVNMISAGEYHSVCATATDVYCWGSNKAGQLGFKPSDVATSKSGCPMLAYPKRVSTKSITKEQVKPRVLQVVAAYSSTLVLLSADSAKNSNGLVADNEVYQWGNGCYSPSKVKFPLTNPLDIYPSAKAFHGFMVCDKAVNIVQISSGKFHCVAVSDLGNVYSWGLGSDQLGHPIDGSSHYSPPRLVEALLPEKGGGKIISVEATANRTCAISDQGDLYTWGATNEQGVLNNVQGTSYQPIPKRVGGVKRASRIAIGEDHTLILTICTRPSLPVESFIQQSIEPTTNNHLHAEEVEEDEEDEARIFAEPVKLALPVAIPTLKQFCERKLSQMAESKYMPMLYAIAETFAASDLKAYCHQYMAM